MVKQHFSEENITIQGPKTVDQLIEFAGEEISLILPEERPGDWELERLVHPAVRYSNNACVCTFRVC